MVVSAIHSICTVHSTITSTYSNSNRATFPTLLRRQRMWVTKGSTPVPSSNWEDAELGDDDGCTDCCSDFFRCLNAETDVSF